MMQNYQSTFVSQKKISILKEPSNTIILLKSAFKDWNPTIFFQYPEYCESEWEMDPLKCASFSQEQFRKNGYQLSFKVTESTHIYNSMVNAMKRAGFSMTSGSAWNILWTGLPRPDTIKSAGQF